MQFQIEDQEFLFIVNPIINGIILFLGIYRFAEGHNIEGLRDISLSYIHDNFFLVSQVRFVKNVLAYGLYVFCH